MNPSKAFDAVLFDFGGVITTSPFDAFSRYESEHQLPDGFIRSINTINPDTNAWAQFESNRIDSEAFNAAFLAESEQAGHPVPGKDIIALLSGDVRPRMVDVLKTCRQYYQIACLTNNVKNGKGPGMSRDAEKTEVIGGLMMLFDVVVESSKEGIRKPQSEFYLRACAKLSVSPERCVFLDDLGINLKPARALGMTTIKVLNERQAIEDLSTTLGIRFSED